MTTNPSLECLIARTAAEREQVYRIRYACYRRDESIAPRPDEQFRDTFDELPNSFSFLVRATPEEVLATVRISVVPDDRHDAPVRHVYGDHPRLAYITREGFVEASRLCFARQARRDAFMSVVGHLAAMASFYDVGWLVACPRVEHAESYQRMFGFEPLAPPRQYFGVAFQTQLLAVSRKDIARYVRHEKSMTTAWSAAFDRLTDASPTSLRSAGLARETACLV